MVARSSGRAAAAWMLGNDAQPVVRMFTFRASSPREGQLLAASDAQRKLLCISQDLINPTASPFTEEVMDFIPTKFLRETLARRDWRVRVSARVGVAEQAWESMQPIKSGSQCGREVAEPPEPWTLSCP